MPDCHSALIIHIAAFSCLAVSGCCILDYQIGTVVISNKILEIKTKKRQRERRRGRERNREMLEWKESLLCQIGALEWICHLIAEWCWWGCLPNDNNWWTFDIELQMIRTNASVMKHLMTSFKMKFIFAVFNILIEKTPVLMNDDNTLTILSHPTMRIAAASLVCQVFSWILNWISLSRLALTLIPIANGHNSKWNQPLHLIIFFFAETKIK